MAPSYRVDLLFVFFDDLAPVDFFVAAPVATASIFLPPFPLPIVADMTPMDALIPSNDSSTFWT